MRDGSGPRRHEQQGGSGEAPSRPSERGRQVAVIGSGGCEEGFETWRLAEEVGRRLGEAGVTVVCGGLGGVMAAVARGAAEAGGEVIGIVPGHSIADANEHCTHVVATGIGHARNLAVVSSGEVVIAIGGEWGTLSEIGFARAIGRTVVALRSWELSGRERMADAPGVIPADSAEEAVAAALSATP
ncbi:MAG TPA: LOG family protein [Solirubrobacterales bacterium]|nr:LOG family protein [Solirubrobacterales bacterium]